METSRRELLQGLLGLGAVAVLPAAAEAKEKRTDLLNEDIESTDLELALLRERFGEELISASKELKNRKTGESVRFLRFEDGNIKWLYTALPGSKVPFSHRHPEAEIYDVISGQIEVCIENEWHLAGAGDRVVIPAMAMHKARNPFNETCEVLVDFDPADFSLHQMGKAYWLACDLGWTSGDGTPNMIKLLPAVRETGRVAYPKGIPKWLVDSLTRT